MTYATLLGLVSIPGSIAAPFVAAQDVAAQDVVAQDVPAPQPLRVVVNSTADEVLANDALTLREAIALTNGTLAASDLSTVEASLVTPATAVSQIAFDLGGDGTIRLQSELPAIAQPVEIQGKLAPDGMPLVGITPAAGVAVFRGLTIESDRVTVRELSIYGFTRTSPIGGLSIFDVINFNPGSIPDLRIPANIFIGSQPYNASRPVPTDITLENNWIGIASNGDAAISAFGVYVFQGNNVTIRGNRIADHSGSGILAQVDAEQLQITDNTIERNGFTGISDGIYLQGNVAGTRISDNRIQSNAGSGIYLFKPEGSVTIEGNTLTNNGLLREKAAIFLMGSDHQVMDNQIVDQNGSGVAIAAAPTSRRNLIRGNQFANLNGLSIDLVSQQNTEPYSFATGDGANPRMESFQRRRQTANFGIDAPQFASREFYLSPSGNVILQGTAAPDATIEIYRVTEAVAEGDRGPLNEAIATAQTNAEGEFSIMLSDLQPGDTLSATATHPDSGTSEPAANFVIRSLPPRASTP
ncbi:MAG: right-handed parallel beta-helix repeat-containing protein [Coleofasciculaceae cyanobacterium SM2_3_26]|nr:right-handed parallel beta-helix repeat-containing protein [Coleofasciculaceae cyanobacterium SM2_3_26]